MYVQCRCKSSFFQALYLPLLYTLGVSFFLAFFWLTVKELFVSLYLEAEANGGDALLMMGGRRGRRGQGDLTDQNGSDFSRNYVGGCGGGFEMHSMLALHNYSTSPRVSYVTAMGEQQQAQQQQLNKNGV